MVTFSMFSVVSPLANLIVVPVSTIMLFVGFGIIILNQLTSIIAQYAAYALWLLVSFMLKIINWLSELPIAILDNLLVPIWIPALTYSLMLIYIIWAKPKST